MNESNTITGFEALFKAAAGGNRGAFWNLVLDPEYGRIVGHELKKLKLNRDIAEETKDAFMMHLLDKLPGIELKSNPRAYLRNVIRNFYISGVRKPGVHTFPFLASNRHKQTGHKTDTKALMDEKISASYAKLSEKMRTGVENAALFVKKLHDVGTRYLKNQTAEKFFRSHDMVENLEKGLIRIWGRDASKILPEFRNLENKKEGDRTPEERRRYGEIIGKYPAIHLFNAVGREKDKARKSSWPLMWDFDLFFLLVFDRYHADQSASFFKLRVDPSCLLFDVLTKMPEMRGAQYMKNKRIELTMKAVNNDGRFTLENLRQYRYRERPRLYKRVVNRIYKRSFRDGVNIGRPFDIIYQCLKENRIEGANKEDVAHAKQIRDQQRKILRQGAAA